MHESLKAKIKQAADLQERRMADWARLVLRDAAETVIASAAKRQALPATGQQSKEAPAPLAMVADCPNETSFPSIPANGAHGIKYPAARTRKSGTK